MKAEQQADFRRTAVALAHVYLIGVLEWALLRVLFLDRWWWLFLLNVFGIYLFMPLPLAVIVAWWTRRRLLWVGWILALLAGAALFGPFYLPSVQKVEVNGPKLKVMTYNVLGYNTDPQPVLDTIREVDADLIAIQELNGPVAEALYGELAEVYPYRVFNPQSGVTGMGVLSRYPITPTAELLPGRWVHTTPQLMTMDFEGISVTVVHAHPFHTHFSSPGAMRESVETRNAQAQAIADFVALQSDPVLAPGDFNSPLHTTAYKHLNKNLVDAWRQRGLGFGHTWPGTFPLRWLIRIDHIFHSADWRTLTVEVGPWDGVSDHRPVVATLVLSVDDGEE